MGNTYCYLAACCGPDSKLRAIKLSRENSVCAGDLIRLDDGDLCTVICAVFVEDGGEEYRRVDRVIQIRDDWFEIYRHGGYRKGNADAVS